LNVVQPSPKAASPPVKNPAQALGQASASSGQPAGSENPYSPGQSVYPAQVPGHGGPRGHYQQSHRGGLILALGIISICCNVAAVPGILAWIFGKNDLKAMDAGLMDPEGRGMTQAGMIMGLVMSIFALIGLVFLICYFLFIFLFVVGVAGAAAGGGM
jgi:hypothetical protein